MTLSILAYDPDELVVGAAVTSCVLAVGRRVVFTRPGVGAVAVQASSEITWADAMLDALQRGESPVAFTSAYGSREDVQVAAIDFGGNHAVFTGATCGAHAGHAATRHATAQVNLAALPDAPERMVTAFDAAAGQPMAERLVAALDASGDDIRGKQSAAVLVTGMGPLTGYAHEPHVDLRVDDSREPVVELSRLLRLHRAHCRMRLAWADATTDFDALIASLLAEHPDDPHLRRAARRLSGS